MSYEKVIYFDIISGDRIISLCDFIIITNDILTFHKNLEHFTDIRNNLIHIDNINISEINLKISQSNEKTIRLFIYTHILDIFINYILLGLDRNKKYILYLHNSDDCLTEEKYNKLSNVEYIDKIYSHNVSLYEPKKLRLLPIGIANCMYIHGNIYELFQVMKENNEKSRNMYVNINTSTYPYRKVVLESIKNNNNFIISSNKPYKEYLQELSKHRFCLCVRGNGISCHRDWECFYLGVIPVFINNDRTKIDGYIKYLQEYNLPICVIDNLEKYNDDFFNEELYKSIVSSSKNYAKTLKLEHYY